MNFNKDEFETSMAYLGRIDTSLVEAGIEPGTLYFVRKQFDPEFITYDADRQVLNFSQYGASNWSVDCLSDFWSKTDFVCSPLGNRDLVWSRVETPVGTYQATDALGARSCPRTWCS